MAPTPATLVSGRSSAKRGTYLGRVRGVRGERIAVELAGPVRRGDGVVFEGDRSQAAEQGGRVYEVFQHRRSVPDEVASGVVELAFRYGAIDRAKIRLGQKVWKTDDPQASRRIRKTYRRGPHPTPHPVGFGGRSRGRQSAPRGCQAAHGPSVPLGVAGAFARGRQASAQRGDAARAIRPPGKNALRVAPAGGEDRRPADDSFERAGKLRHEMVRLLDAAAMQPPERAIFEGSALAALRAGQERDRSPLSRKRERGRG